MSEFERIRKQQERDAEKARRAEVAQKKEFLRLEKLRDAEAKKTEAERMNISISERVNELQTLLMRGLEALTNLSLSQLRRKPAIPPLALGALEVPNNPPGWEHFAPPPAGFLRSAFSSAQVAKELEQAKASFARATSEHAATEARREEAIKKRRNNHAIQVERETAAVRRYNAGLLELRAQVDARKKGAVETHLLTMLNLVPLPHGFPREVQVAFNPSAEQVVVEIELPKPDCIPNIKSARYVASTGKIIESTRAAKEKAELYKNIVAQLSLLTLKAMFSLDSPIQEVSLNSRVRHINPATGQEERPHIISVVVTRSDFDPLILERVRPDDCLRHLRAKVSSHPFELEPIEPIVDFDKSRLAFVDGLEVVSSLDSRPDLMAMSPTDFEHLIRQLLEADPSIELVESLTTRQSNDGGVDGVVYIRQPFGRSMTVVQVKQYAKNRTLGPTHIRELIGAMHEVKAGNGLLVTTSSFSSIATANADEFGRISLIDGNNLVFMIKRLLGKDVLIGKRQR